MASENEVKQWEESICGDEKESSQVCVPRFMCRVCGKHDTIMNLPRKMQGFFFHCECHAGYRAYHRTVDKGSQEDLEQQHEMFHDQPKWGTRILPWVNQNERGLLRSDRKRKFQEINKTEGYDDNSNIDDLLHLDLVTYTSYFGFWRRWDDPKCAKEFWAEHKRQNGIHDDPKSNVPMVKVPDISRTRTQSGTRSSDAAQSVTEIDEQESAVKKRRLKAKTTEASARGYGAVVVQASQKQASEGVVFDAGHGAGGPRRSNSVARVSSGGAASVRSRSFSPTPSSRRSPARECGQETPLAGKSLAERNKESGPTAESTKSRRRKAFFVTPLQDLKAASLDMEPGEFTMLQESLAKEIGKALAQYNLKSGYKAQIAKRFDKCDQTRASKLKPSPRDVLSEIDDMIDSLQQASDKVMDCTVEVIVELEAEVKELLAAATEDLATRCKKVVDALDLLAKKSAADKRSVRMAKFHQVEKAAKSLVAAGYAPEFAKLVADSVLQITTLKDELADTPTAPGSDLEHKGAEQRLQAHQIQISGQDSCISFAVDPEQLDMSKITLCVDPSGAVHGFVKRYQNGSERLLSDQMTRHDRRMGAEENAKWLGVLGTIPSNFQEVIGFQPACQPIEYKHAGAAACLCTLRAHRRRDGAAAYLWPGFPHVVEASSADMFFFICEAGPLLKLGCAISDVAHLLGTGAGVKFFKKHGCTLFLRKGNIAYIPHGLLAMPYFRPEDDTAWGHLWILPLMSKESLSAASIEEDSKGTLMTYNVKYLKSKSDAMHKARLEYLELVKTAMA